MESEPKLNRLDLMRQGFWHHGIAPEIESGLKACADLCFELNSLPPSLTGQREKLFRKILGSIGERFIIHSPFRCDFGSHIHIGNDFIGNFNMTILDEAPVTIGDHVFIGPNVSIYTIIHALDPNQRNEGIMQAKPVTIGNDVWIGGNTIILPGVKIGDGAVIGAGSIVTRDIPPLTLAIGSPCKPVREISASDIITDIADSIPE